MQDYQISFTGRFNIYDLILDQPYFDSSYGAVSKEHMTLIKVRVAIFFNTKMKKTFLEPKCPTHFKVVFCRILGALFCYGYDVVTSTDVARDCLTHCAAFFRLREPQENWKLHAYSHKFICVAPYGADQLLLVNIPKVAVEEIYKVSSQGRGIHI